VGTRQGRGAAGQAAVAAGAPGGVTPAPPRASGPSPRTPQPVPAPAMTITAEIPVVALAGGGETPRRRRKPAPYALRSMVWALLFVLVVLIAAYAVEHSHPTWFNVLRHTSSGLAAPSSTSGVATTLSGNSPGSPASGGARSSSSGTKKTVSAKLTEVSSSAKGATYAFSGSSYELVVATSKPAWTIVDAPPSARKPTYEETVLPSTSPHAFAVVGSARMQVWAAARSITVIVNGRRVGSISNPAVGPFTYTFLPTHP